MMKHIEVDPVQGVTETRRSEIVASILTPWVVICTRKLKVCICRIICQKLISITHSYKLQLLFYPRTKENPSSGLRL